MKTLITSIFMLAAIAAYSQNGDDTIFPLHDSKWVVEYDDSLFYNHVYQETALDYYTLSDSTIGKKQWKKVSDIYGFGTWTRVDSLKVRILVPSEEGSNALMDTVAMDFGLNIGDTLWHIDGGIDTSIGLYTWVDSINYILLGDGRQHKELHIASSNPDMRSPTWWIEGVGSSMGVIWWDSQESPGVYKRTYTTTCYFNEGFQIYSQASPSGLFDCDQIVIATNVPPIQGTTAAQNMFAYPMNGKIFIQNKSDYSGMAIIYNLNGQVVWHNYLVANGNVLSDILPSGEMYLVRFNSQTVKIVL